MNLKEIGEFGFIKKISRDCLIRPDHIIKGIGGLNRENSADVIRSGADGVAVVSAIVAADDPKAAAIELKQVITEARKS